MTYNRDVISIQNELQAAWNGVRAAVSQMYYSSDIRPGDARDVFSPDASSREPKFIAGPVVFRVPERASSPTADLYVVLSGWISFAPPRNADPRRTTLRFGTGVGYFHAKADQLTHVYGAHYDMDEELPGHPVFHVQMCSQAGLATAIIERFHMSFDKQDDRTAGLLPNIRTPTAQMDVFSVITQIGADHLVSEASGPEVHAAFRKLRGACDFFVGAAGRLAYLCNAPAAQCYRSTHWYGRADSEVA